MVESIMRNISGKMHLDQWCQAAMPFKYSSIFSSKVAIFV